jgi:hypothetical protein
VEQAVHSLFGTPFEQNSSHFVIESIKSNLSSIAVEIKRNSPLNQNVLILA